MPVVALTALWLAASPPAVPVAENSESLPAPAAAANLPEGRNKPKPNQTPTGAKKKSGPDNDEPGCEE